MIQKKKKRFLKEDKKGINQKLKIDKLNYIKVKNIYSSIDTVTITKSKTHSGKINKGFIN